MIFMISVDVIKHSEAHLTSKNRSSKNLLSCLEALYMVYSMCMCVRGEREREREERGAYIILPRHCIYGHIILCMYLKVHGCWWLANAQHVAGGG